MVIYIFGLFLLSGLGCCSFIFKNNKKVIISLIVVACLFMWCLSSFKSTSIGTDTPVYLEWYANGKNFSSIMTYRDVGYGFYQFICANLNIPWNLFLALSFSVLYIGVGLYAYYFSKYPLLMIFIVYTFALFYFSLSGIRQSMSVGFCLIGMTLFRKKKIINWVLCYLFFLIAILFHRAAIVIVIYPLLSMLKLTKKSFYYLLILTIVLVIFSKYIELFFSYVIPYLEYAPETKTSNYSLIFAIIVFLVVASAIFFPHQYDSLNEKIDHLFKRNKASNNVEISDSVECAIEKKKIEENYFISVPFLFFLILGLYSTVTVRGYYFFHLPFALLICSFIGSQKSKIVRIILLVLAYLFFAFYFCWAFLLNAGTDYVPYQFFFQ